MRGTNHRPVTVLLSMVVLVAGCSSSVASLAPGPSTSSSRGAASATPTSAATPTPRRSASPMPTPTASGVTLDTVAVTLVDGLRVRSKPRVSDDSFKEEPPLPLGTQPHLLDGPMSASDYTWYEVAPLSSRVHPRGWVASAGRDGEPWLGAGDFACPPLPRDLRSLAALPSGVGLACFPRLPITVTAHLTDRMPPAVRSPSHWPVGRAMHRRWQRPSPRRPWPRATPDGNAWISISTYCWGPPPSPASTARM
jgi:hypothetical protein